MDDEEAAASLNETEQSDREVSPEASRYVAYFEGGREGVATLCEPDVPRVVVLTKISEALREVGGDLPSSAVNMAKVYSQPASIGAITRFGAASSGEIFGLSSEFSKDDPYLACITGAVIAAGTARRNGGLADGLDRHLVKRTEAPGFEAANRALGVVSSSLRAADRPAMETTAVRMD